MPVLLAGREPDDVARPDFFDRPTLALHPTYAGGHDQRLPEGMRVPRGACLGFEGDAGTAHARRFRCLEKRVDANAPVNHSAGPLLEACEPHRLISMVSLLRFVDVSSAASAAAGPDAATARLATAPSMRLRVKLKLLERLPASAWLPLRHCGLSRMSLSIGLEAFG